MKPYEYYADNDEFTGTFQKCFTSCQPRKTIGAGSEAIRRQFQMKFIAFVLVPERASAVMNMSGSS